MLKGATADDFSTSHSGTVNVSDLTALISLDWSIQLDHGGNADA